MFFHPWLRETRSEDGDSTEIQATHSNRSSLITHSSRSTRIWKIIFKTKNLMGTPSRVFRAAARRGITPQIKSNLLCYKGTPLDKGMQAQLHRTRLWTKSDLAYMCTTPQLAWPKLVHAGTMTHTGIII